MSVENHDCPTVPKPGFGTVGQQCNERDSAWDMAGTPIQDFQPFQHDGRSEKWDRGWDTVGTSCPKPDAAGAGAWDSNIGSPTKVCSTCEKPRPIGRFPANKNEGDGQHHRCLDCIKELAAVERVRRESGRALS